ncbi:MAG TPA: 16S rRNA (guanine(527)-N(7))-methyltransferase RsmG, partial [Bacteroidales bacterium]|nr:16S rRNA (guanine(527)-N(7))-methyltransferase RsmG [Bacteroidales bacterium]
VISRKDIDHINERHILHSLSIAKVVNFAPGTTVLDVGTGGGFPGIPLAILFPETQFLLIDSIGKKIKVVEAVANSLKLENVEARHVRGEKLKEEFDFITSRAVTNLPRFFQWTKAKIDRKNQFNEIPNGIIYLKGGDFEDELKQINWKKNVQPIDQLFEESFFETKKIVHLYPGKK